MVETSYVHGGSSSGSTASDDKSDDGAYWTLGKCKKAYLDYLGSKRDEIDEQQDARRYYHGSQWTAAQIEVLKKRKQPQMTYNRVGRKIDGVVGLIERLRQDPKAFPRTPKHEDGAELATSVLRYKLDDQDWKAKSPEVARSGAIDGIGGVEIELTKGDQGDHDVGFEVVDTESFFYDPRSVRPDFSDARFMGVGKWVDLDTAKELVPGKDAQLEASTESSTELTSGSDRESKWFTNDGAVRRVRLVDIWYKHKNEWCWAIFNGSQVLMEGKSYLVDEKNRGECKYVMFSCNVDQDGDRYGFVRNLKSPQDGINAKHSKLQHITASRRLIISQNAVQDIELARREWARADGVVVTNPGNVNEHIKLDDQTADYMGWTKLLEADKDEIENFGPNPALIGQGIENKSGRAIALLQQAGMADLGPYILAYRGWKLRVYRVLWNAVQRHWTAERWVRVTDDDNVAQFIQVNGVGIDPMTGQPTMVNAVGSLDVDIILDESQDSITIAQDTFEALSTLLPSVAPMLTPPEAQVVLKALFEVAPLPSSVRKTVRDGFAQAEQQAQQPDPMKQQAMQIQLAAEAAKVEETKSKSMLNMSKAHESQMPEMGQPYQPPDFEIPPEIQVAKAVADIDYVHANTENKRVMTQLAPAKANHDAAMSEQQMAQRRQQMQQRPRPAA